MKKFRIGSGLQKFHIHTPLTRDERTVKIFALSPVLTKKMESNAVLIRKFFENHQSDPILIRPCETVHFYQVVFVLPHDAKALLELFCHKRNMIG